VEVQQWLGPKISNSSTGGRRRRETKRPLGAILPVSGAHLRPPKLRPTREKGERRSCASAVRKDEVEK
jgi:hypothetical protein